MGFNNLKHTIKTIILLVGSLLMYNSAMAANWMLIGSDDESSAYLDMESIKRENNTVKFWMKQEYKKIKDTAGIKHKTILYYSLIDCMEKTLGSTKQVAYDSDGKVVFSKNYPIDMVPIVPDSIGEFVFKQQCK